MAVKYFNEDCNYRLKGKRLIAAWVRQTVESEGFSCGDINYIFCSPERHIEINRQYLNHDYHTDVITFDYSDLTDERVVSGDVFIDPETVALNAAEYGATPRGEMLRVLIHGVLHLCGYKDKAPAEERQMRAKEDFYLARLEE